MICEICNKGNLTQLTVFEGKYLCNYCLGANYPYWLEKQQKNEKEIFNLKDKLRRRNMQIKDLKEIILRDKAYIRELEEDMQDVNL